MEKKKNFKTDIILIAALLVAGAIVALILLLGGKNGSNVSVLVDGEVVKEFPLSENTTYEIEGIDGGRNYLVIEDGQAWLEDADCPDKLCVGMGKISKDGQSIVCLPHKVVVEVSGDGTNSDDVDMIVK